MILVLCASAFAVALAMALQNDVLAQHSYALYGLQLATMIPYLLRKAVFLKNLFLPSFFVLVYFLLNLTLGSYLVPRDYGWNREFTDVALAIRHYKLIVPYLLLANVVLFLLTDLAFRRMNALSRNMERGSPPHTGARGEAWGMGRMPFYFAAFFLVSYFDVYSAFSFQLAILIVHTTDPAMRGRWYRFGVYAYYLMTMVAFDFGNKREIAIVLFLIMFVEAYFGRIVLRFGLRNLAAFAAVAASFFALILAASILRGYGDFPVTSVFQAISYIPRYMTSEMFIDGITDNLELNYNYGCAITSIDLGIRGLIDYQYGASLIKPLFLPIPRELLPWKPESIMQIFTQVYAPEWWLEEGSMPVMFASEMFLNFSYLGLAPFALVLGLINRLFVGFHLAPPGSFAFLSCAFLSITVLTLARGGGIEQYLLYYLLAIPVFLVVMLLRQSSREPGRAAAQVHVHS